MRETTKRSTTTVGSFRHCDTTGTLPASSIKTVPLVPSPQPSGFQAILLIMAACTELICVASFSIAMSRSPQRASLFNSSTWFT
uniref:Uncharacterized protein n=1 Tax=Anopheles coluzzii TaxID=1518534 RepID=A0A8W7P2J9_ANOCL